MYKNYFKMAVLIIAAILLIVTNAIAQSPLQIGSANTATADPPETRPNTTPCVVQLFSNVGPLNGNPNPFSFTPPAGCPGPWAKVILSADFSVNAGRQQDRTTSIWIGATNILYGSAMQPSTNLGRTWHVERDVTDYSALFTKPQTGQLTVLTAVNAVQTSIISGTGSLLFFPASHSSPASVTPDVVLPLSLDPVLGGQVFVTGADTLSRTFTMPRNVERAFIDIIVRNASAASDEFYYLCVPDPAIAAQLLTCPGTPFREAEITIDGQPAGVAPAFPRVTEGSIDPFLWRPIPGLIAVNFRPFRVDITPFAGLLSNGLPHQIGINVVNANPFALNGAVLLFLDHGSSQVTGGLEVNTLGSPNPVSTQNVSTKNGTTSGTFAVKSARDFTIRGFVNTSHGRIDTEVAQRVEFLNTQNFTIGASSFNQDVRQRSTVRSLTTVRGPRGRHGDDGDQATLQEAEFPIAVNISITTNPDGSLTQTASVNEHHSRRVAAKGDGDDDGRGGPSSSVIDTAASSADTVFFSPTFAIVGNQGQSSSQSYFSRSSSGDCFSRTITAANGILTSIDDGKSCRNRDKDKDKD